MDRAGSGVDEDELFAHLEGTAPRPDELLGKPCAPQRKAPADTESPRVPQQRLSSFDGRSVRSSEAARTKRQPPVDKEAESRLIRELQEEEDMWHKQSQRHNEYGAPYPTANPPRANGVHVAPNSGGLWGRPHDPSNSTFPNSSLNAGGSPEYAPPTNRRPLAARPALYGGAADPQPATQPIAESGSGGARSLAQVDSQVFGILAEMDRMRTSGFDVVPLRLAEDLHGCYSYQSKELARQHQTVAEGQRHRQLLQDEAEKLREANHILVESMKKKKDDFRLADEAIAQRAVAEQRTAELGTKLRQLAEMETEVARLRENEENTASILGVCEEALRTSKENNTTLRSERDALMQALEKREDELQQLEEVLRDSHTSIEATQRAGLDLATERQCELDRALAERSECETRSALLCADLQCQKDLVGDLERQVQGMERAVADRDATIAAMRNQLTDLEMNNLGAEAKATRTSAAIERSARTAKVRLSCTREKAASILGSRSTSSWLHTRYSVWWQFAQQCRINVEIGKQRTQLGAGMKEASRRQEQAEQQVRDLASRSDSEKKELVATIAELRGASDKERALQESQTREFVAGAERDRDAALAACAQQKVQFERRIGEQDRELATLKRAQQASAQGADRHRLAAVQTHEPSCRAQLQLSEELARRSISEALRLLREQFLWTARLARLEAELRPSSEDSVQKTPPADVGNKVWHVTTTLFPQLEMDKLMAKIQASVDRVVQQARTRTLEVTELKILAEGREAQNAALPEKQGEELAEQSRAESARLQAALHATSTEIAIFKQSALENERALRSELEAARSEYDTLRQRLKDDNPPEEGTPDLHDLVRDLSEKVRLLESETQTLRRELDAAKQQRDKLDHDLERCRSHGQEKQQTIDRLQRALDDARDGQEPPSQGDESRKQLQEGTAERDLGAKQATELQTMANACKAELERLQQELDTVKKQRDKLERDLGLCRSHGRDKEQTIDSLRRELDESRSETQADTIQKQLEECTAERDALSKHADDSARVAATLEERANACDLEAKRLQQELHVVERQRDEFERDLSLCRSHGRDKEQTIDSLRRELDETRGEQQQPTQLEECIREKDALSKQAEKSVLQAAELQEKAHAAESESLRLQRELDTTRKQRDELERGLALCRSKIRQDREKLEKQPDTSGNERQESFEAQVVDLRCEAEEAARACKALADERDQASHELEKLVTGSIANNSAAGADSFGRGSNTNDDDRRFLAAELSKSAERCRCLEKELNEAVACLNGRQGSGHTDIGQVIALEGAIARDTTADSERVVEEDLHEVLELTTQLIDAEALADSLREHVTELELDCSAKDRQLAQLAEQAAHDAEEASQAEELERTTTASQAVKQGELIRTNDALVRERDILSAKVSRLLEEVETLEQQQPRQIGSSSSGKVCGPAPDLYQLELSGRQACELAEAADLCDSGLSFAASIMRELAAGHRKAPPDEAESCHPGAETGADGDLEVSGGSTSGEELARLQQLAASKKECERLAESQHDMQKQLQHRQQHLQHQGDSPSTRRGDRLATPSPEETLSRSSGSGMGLTASDERSANTSTTVTGHESRSDLIKRIAILQSAVAALQAQKYMHECTNDATAAATFTSDRAVQCSSADAAGDGSAKSLDTRKAEVKQSRENEELKERLEVNLRQQDELIQRWEEVAHDYEVQKTTLNKELDLLRRHLTDANCENAKLKSLNAQLDLESHTHRDTEVAKEEQPPGLLDQAENVAAAATKQAGVEGEKQSLQNDVERLKKELQSAKEAAEKQAQAFDTLERENTDLQLNSEKLRDDTHRLNKSLVEEVSKNKAMHSSLCETDTARKALTVETPVLRDSARMVIAERDAIQDELTRSQREVSYLREQGVRSAERKRELPPGQDTRAAAAQAEHSRLKAQQSGLKDQLSALRNELKKRNEKVRILEDEVRCATSAAADASNAIDRLEADNLKLRVELGVQKNCISAKVSMFKTKQDGCPDADTAGDVPVPLSTQSVAGDSRLHSLESSLQLKQQAYQEQGERLLIALSQAECEREQKESANAKLRDATDNNRRLRTELEDLRTHVKRLQGVYTLEATVDGSDALDTSQRSVASSESQRVLTEQCDQLAARWQQKEKEFIRQVQLMKDREHQAVTAITMQKEAAERRVEILQAKHDFEMQQLKRGEHSFDRKLSFKETVVHLEAPHVPVLQEFSSIKKAGRNHRAQAVEPNLRALSRLLLLAQAWRSFCAFHIFQLRQTKQTTLRQLIPIVGNQLSIGSAVSCLVNMHSAEAAKSHSLEAQLKEMLRKAQAWEGEANRQQVELNWKNHRLKLLQGTMAGGELQNRALESDSGHEKPQSIRSGSVNFKDLMKKE
ncbi:hypothetical protein DIPPA_30321 [Diplonema papillatum]|nr:hypothetical protein DIPPA_30321 [Diplonema papillatum]KAJ9450967.1 hypothetical protein DIPPA_30321 [Diplonema papillatum]